MVVIKNLLLYTISKLKSKHVDDENNKKKKYLKIFKNIETGSIQYLELYYNVSCFLVSASKQYEKKYCTLIVPYSLVQIGENVVRYSLFQDLWKVSRSCHFQFGVEK